ncbi:HTH domain-containing protein [Nocardia colli]|uniref:HTH domain-containing protein n=2 Tax=Nocardia colli TaxID=2545717 RepID=A0A5N0ED36_9NOCA|nr:HTH domain-containing protein [Nocardia colli]
MVVQPEGESRGVVIDNGRIGVLHHDLEGVTIRTDCVIAAPNGARPPNRSRRFDVLRGVADGVTDEELAERLNVSIKTIRRDVAWLRDLIGCDSRASLVATTRTLHLV